MAGSQNDEAAYDRRLEALKQREQRVAKKDKDLSQRFADLDRRAKSIEETEDKLGSVAAREAQCDQRDKENSAATREAKKRDRALRDLEQQLSEKEAELFSKEAYVSSQQRELEAKLRAIDSRESEIVGKEAVAEESVRRAAARQQKLDDLEAELRARDEATKALEAKLAARSRRITEQEAALAASQRECTLQAEANEKTSSQLQQRLTAVTGREATVANERERLLRRKGAVDEAEAKAAADTKALALRKEELQRRMLHLEEEEASVRRRLEDASRVQAEAQQKRDAVEKQIADNRQYEQELHALKAEIKQLEADVRSRERKVALQQRGQQQRELVIQAKEADADARMREVAAREVAVAASADGVTLREEAALSRENANAADAERCAQRELAIANKTQLLQRKERDLVEWMKEMEWRETMLGDREAVVDREPVTVASVITKRGFSNKAFGHAMLEVQLRRLKDQYISAQMRHARQELRTGHGPFKRRKRLPRAGIATTDSEACVDDDIEETSALWEARGRVHKMATEFVRRMARSRAFDSFEDPVSPERLEHLSHFSEHERTLLCMAANTEYMLRIFEDFFVSRMTCPLDRKDKASDVQDLVNQTAKWWREARKHMRGCLGQLLRDRERYLSDSLRILESKPEAQSHHNFHSMVTDLGQQSADHGNAQPSGAADHPYTATSSFEHVRESRLLAPRGLATLKAVSSSVADEASAAETTQPAAAKHRPSTQPLRAAASLAADDGSYSGGSRRDLGDARAVTPLRSTLGSPSSGGGSGGSRVDFANGTNVVTESALMWTARACPASAGSLRNRPFDVDSVNVPGSSPKQALASPYKLARCGLRCSSAKSPAAVCKDKGVAAPATGTAAAPAPLKSLYKEAVSPPRRRVAL